MNYVAAAFAGRAEAARGRRVLMLFEDMAEGYELSTILTKDGLSVELSASSGTGVDVVADGDYAVLVLDQRRDIGATLELTASVQRALPALSVVHILRGELSPTVVEALQLGVLNFLTKGLDQRSLGPHLLDTIRRAVDAGGRESALPASSARRRRPVTLDSALVGESPMIREARARLMAAMTDNAPVLVVGEVGTEKLTVARALHASRQSLGSFVVFEPTSTSAKGFAEELTQNCTVFVTEVGALDSACEPLLTQWLAAGDSTQPRVVAALSQPPPRHWEGSAVAKLFAAARSHQIELPPLRARGDDLHLLIEDFLERARLARGDPFLRLGERVLTALESYHWRGNVDELGSCLQHAVSLCSHSTIELHDLPPAMALELSSALGPGGVGALVRSLDDIDRWYIRRVLAAVAGNRSQASRLLQVDRTTLYRRLKPATMSSTQQADLEPENERSP